MNILRNVIWIAVIAASGSLTVGCIKKQAGQVRPIAEQEELECVLAIALDLSQSFSGEFGDKAYPMALALIEKFATEYQGANCKIVLSQISGNDQTVLFEGSPEALRVRFRSPAEFRAFLLETSEAGKSPVYAATGELLSYVVRMRGAGPNTRFVATILGDMRDSETERSKRSEQGYRMLAAMKTYREQGGSLALYFVHEDEVWRWLKIFELAEIDPAQYMICNRLEFEPELPRFD